MNQIQVNEKRLRGKGRNVELESESEGKEEGKRGSREF